jgi:branched-chain amino acid transport system substrate-binding protein
MTSSMAEAVLPVATRAGLVMVSPTVTASNLRGKDDLLFKVAPSVEEHTRRMADFLFARGLKRGAIAFDLSNKAYTADWTEHFRRDFTAHGGAIAAEASFTSGDDAAYGDVIKTLAASKPDFLLFITSAVDAVRLAQLARNLGLTQPVASSTWAATEALLQLGGRTIEGVVLTQFFNRDDRSPRYLLFAEAFRARFKQDPGFASVAAYDATSAVLKALEKSQGTALKDALLASGPYQGLQESWNFDRNGDAVRQTRIAMVRSGRFVIVD